MSDISILKSILPNTTIKGTLDVEKKITGSDIATTEWETLKYEAFIQYSTTGKTDGDAIISLLSSGSLSYDNAYLSANHQGVVTITSSGSTGSGAIFSLMFANQYKLQGNEKYKVIFRTGPGVNTRSIRLGIHNSSSHGVPDDGIYLIISDGTGGVYVRVGGSNTYSEASIYTFSATTWYRLEIDINSDATGFTYRVYTDDDDVLVASNDVIATLPSSVGIPPRAIFALTTTATLEIGAIDYMSFKYPKLKGRD